MKIALCMSGLTRTFKKCYQSYLDNIINLYDCDVFTFVGIDKNSPNIDLIKHTKKVLVDNEPHHDEKDYAQYKALRTRFYSIQGWLSQFWKIKKCHELMLDHQMEHGIKYDWVIRCRPDLMILRKFDELPTLDKRYIYTPPYPLEPPMFSFINRAEGCLKDGYIYNGENGGYLPDQFAVSTVELMGIYARRYDDLDKVIHAERTARFCSEYSLGRQLKFYGVQVKILQPLIRIQR